MFDLDGLLIDSEREYDRAMKASIIHYGYEITDEFLTSTRGATVPTFIRALKKEFGEDFPIQSFRSDFKSLMWENIRKYGMPTKRGVHSLIDYLKANNIRFAVATSNYRDMALDLLEAAGIQEIFQNMVCGDEVKNGKPSPEIYIKAAEILRVNIKKSLVLEDSYNGIRAGHASGAKVIMIPDILKPTEEIKGMVDFVVENLSEVIPCISRL